MTTKDKLTLYRNYLATLEYNKEYGNKYGDTKELIEIYEKKLEIKKEVNKDVQIHKRLR